MAKETRAQQKTVERVMHEFKQGKLKSGGDGAPVKRRRQAVAIALSEAGASRNAGAGKDGKTGGRTAATKSAKAAQGKSPRGKVAQAEPTRAELYAKATRQGVAGRSRMSKEALRRAVMHH